MEAIKASWFEQIARAWQGGFGNSTPRPNPPTGLCFWILAAKRHKKHKRFESEEATPLQTLLFLLCFLCLFAAKIQKHNSEFFKLIHIKSLIGRFPFFPARRAEPPPSSAPVSAPAREWPSPVLSWVGQDKTIALRGFNWETDADFICSWQRETYAINFPDFKLSLEFSGAFRHDLRRAHLDDSHALWMLDDPKSSPCGFIWVVLCTNSWTNERYGYVNNLFIEASHRGQHLGEELLEHAAKWFKARKVERLRLTVTGSNAAAVRLYERAGFIVERLEMERGL